jgi:hypothetical protein
MNSSKPALKRPTKPSPFADLPFDSWPAVLPKTSEDPVLPLAIGIADDLMLRLRRCLRTRGTTFRSSCEEPGIGFDGREEAGGQRGVDAFEELQENETDRVAVREKPIAA